jgi:hypothetical protein
VKKILEICAVVDQFVVLVDFLKVGYHLKNSSIIVSVAQIG